MYEAVKYVTLDEHAYLFGFWWMSDAWLQSLPADLQDLVIDGVQQASMIQSDWNKEYDSRALARVCWLWRYDIRPISRRKSDIRYSPR